MMIVCRLEVFDSAFPSSSTKAMPISLGEYIIQRLIQLNVASVFSVPGDFNLALLDLFEDEPNINLIGCCNEVSRSFHLGWTTSDITNIVVIFVGGNELVECWLCRGWLCKDKAISTESSAL
jgi:hypothetical protein